MKLLMLTRNRYLCLPILIVATLLISGAWLVVTHDVISDKSDETWERIQRTRVVRIGIDATYPPFETTDAAGTFQGYDVDLARALGERWQVDVQFVPIHFDGLYNALKADKCDLIISALPYDRTMTRDNLYSSPYLTLGQVLVTEEFSGITSWRSLAGKSVSVELGSEAHQLLRQIVRDTGQEIRITAQREPEAVLADLLEDRVQAVVVDRAVAIGYIRQHPQLAQVGELRDEIPLVIAAHIQAPETIAQVNSALDAFSSDGILRAFEERWF